MTDLAIAVLSSAAGSRTRRVPTMLLRLRIDVHRSRAGARDGAEGPDPHRAAASPVLSRAEEERLVELFGEAPQWGESLKPFLWTHVSTTVAEFTGSVEVDLPVPCSYDFEVAAAKYLHSIGDGDIPLVLLFSGTVFSYRNGGLVVQPIAWNVEADHRLPASVWRATMDSFFPNSGWIRVSRETIDALTRYKAERALTSWEDTFERLLKEAE